MFVIIMLDVKVNLCVLGEGNAFSIILPLEQGLLLQRLSLETCIVGQRLNSVFDEDESGSSQGEVSGFCHYPFLG